MSEPEAKESTLSTHDESKPVVYEIKKGDMSILKDLLDRKLINERVFKKMQTVVMQRDIELTVLFGYDIIPPLEED